MDLIFATNARFTKAKDGHIYGVNTSLNYLSFSHYLAEFNNIYILARVENKNDIIKPELRINKGRIKVLEVPYYLGALQFFKKRKAIKKAIAEYLKVDAVVICRVPGAIGRITASKLLRNKKPFAIEVAGDPQEIYAPHAFKHRLRPLLRWHGVYNLKKMLQKASAALYVTENALQNRYPVRSGVFNTYASNVILKSDAFISIPKKNQEKEIYKICSIGTLDQMYKAPDILLRAIAICINKGIKLELYWLGGGAYQNQMKALALSLGIEGNVNFLGIVKPAEKVREILDKCDIYVQPSRTEGLPRALIEAMARGLPCIGTNIGGIPELIDKDWLVPINNAELIANKILYLLNNPTVYHKAAEKNLIKSKEYCYELLNKRRVEFYKKIIELTAGSNT